MFYDYQPELTFRWNCKNGKRFIFEYCDSAFIYLSLDPILVKMIKKTTNAFLIESEFLFFF
jgi:hypothetical protein